MRVASDKAFSFCLSVRTFMAGFELKPVDIVMKKNKESVQLFFFPVRLQLVNLND